MSNRWRVHKALDAVNSLRRLLLSYGRSLDLQQAVEPAALAQAYLDCQVIALPDLTDRRAMEYLAREWGIDVDDEQLGEAPQAGGLYVAESGTHRWIFIEPADHARRRKFTIAHEIGHLIVEAIPELERQASSLGTLLPEAAPKRLLKYGRCALSRGARLTAADKRELDAHDFAAELLMPVEGVRALIRRQFPTGFPTEQQISDLVRLLVATYDVSWEAAERRVGILDITALDAGPNGDLFAI